MIRPRCQISNDTQYTCWMYFLMCRRKAPPSSITTIGTSNFHIDLSQRQGSSQHFAHFQKLLTKKDNQKTKSNCQLNNVKASTQSMKKAFTCSKGPISSISLLSPGEIEIFLTGRINLEGVVKRNNPGYVPPKLKGT